MPIPIYTEHLTNPELAEIMTKSINTVVMRIVNDILADAIRKNCVTRDVDNDNESDTSIAQIDDFANTYTNLERAKIVPKKKWFSGRKLFK